MNSPAFLFYSKDWIADTADWEPDSKGVYIDLLAHQHVNGSLPSDERKLARIARLSFDEFSEIWATIKHKFEQEGDHVVNRRLNQVITENNQKALKNKITGIFAVKIRTLEISSKQIAEIKKIFDIERFTGIPEGNLKDEIYKWVDQTVNQMVNQTVNRSEDVNANANEDVNNSSLPGISRKKFTPPSLQEFTRYFEENGYSIELAERAFKGYDAANWNDSEGKPVKNWKQKCQHVWFTPKNKTAIKNSQNSKQNEISGW